MGTRDVGDACTLPSVRVHTIGAPIANVACRVMICPSTSRSSLSVWVERAVGARRVGDDCTLPSVRVHTIGAPIANAACRVMIDALPLH